MVVATAIRPSEQWQAMACCGQICRCGDRDESYGLALIGVAAQSLAGMWHIYESRHVYGHVLAPVPRRRWSLLAQGGSLPEYPAPSTLVP